MTIKELLNTQRQNLAICPICAAIKELYGRINRARNFPHLATHIPAWQEGARQLKALKTKGIKTIMDAMPQAVILEAEVTRFRQAEREIMRRDDIVLLVQEEALRLARLEPIQKIKEEEKP